MSVALVLVAALVLGCNGSNDNRTSFKSFVVNMIGSTSETSEPVSLEGIDFRFDEDPNAFNSLFQ